MLQSAPGRPLSQPPDLFEPDPETRQFTTRRILLLAVLCAALAGAAQALDLPLAVRVIFTFWWMALAAYGMFRMPYGILTLLGRTKRQERLKAQRAELERMVARKRSEAQIPSDTELPESSEFGD